MRRKEKLFALLLAVVMLLGLVGCGGKEADKESKEPEKTTEGTEPSKNEAPAEEDPTSEATEPSETEMDENLTIHENTYFTVGYREEDGWTLSEDDFYTSEYGGNVYLRILNDDGYTGLLVRIEAYEEEASTFRSTLHANGVDMEAYVAGTWKTETIGGLSMAAVDKEDGEWAFYGRNEAAGVSYTVDVTDWEDSHVPAIIENISFTASGTDNVDPPWPWEGEAISGGSLSQLVGDRTLTAEFLPMAEPMITYETFNHDIAVLGDKVYILSDAKLYEYAYDGSSLTFLKEIPLSDEYEVLDRGAEGEMILSAFMTPALGHNGESELFSYEGPEYFAVAPGGTWGISWFYSGDDCMLYSFRDGTLAGSEFPFPEVESISSVTIDSNYILVSGSAVEDNEQYLFAYDYAGELQLQMGGEPGGFGLGSITYAMSTENGFLALDGNMREVVLWSADGTWIGAADDGDLFDTSYPWIAAADVAPDGSLLIIMSDERPDGSADEVIVFKLSGF